MCGIAGLVDLNGLRAEDAAARTNAALNRIRMRGPHPIEARGAGKPAEAREELTPVETHH